MKRLVVVVLFSVMFSCPTYALEYTLHDLGRGEAFGINDLGQITGWRPDPNSGPSKAFLWSKESGFTDIGPSTGRAINNLGQVAGDGWMWSQEDGLVPLSLPSGVVNVASSAMNNSGQIVGWVKFNTNVYHAFLWNSPSNYIDLGVPYGWSGWAYDINENGAVVGEMTNVINNHAFFWSLSSGFVDLGDFNSTFARADGINEAGQIVGTYQPNDFRHAFLLDENLIDIGTINGGHHSTARRINNSGFVVGSSMYISGEPEPHAFVWDKDFGIQDLGPGHSTYSKSTDINNHGQIVGLFWDENDLEHIALWEPIPEPSGILALFSGIGFFGILRRRRW